MRFFIIVIISLLALTACGGAFPPRPETDGLTPIINGQDYILIERPISYKQHAGGIETEIGLAPGIYRAERENGLGTFFGGSGRPMWIKTETIDRVTVRPAGIWMPKNPSEVPEMYFVFEKCSYYISDLDLYFLTYSKTTHNAADMGELDAVGTVNYSGCVGLFSEPDIGKILLFGKMPPPEFVTKLVAGLHKAKIE